MPGSVVLELVVIVSPLELVVVPEVVGAALVIETALVSLVVASLVVSLLVDEDDDSVALPVTGPAVVELVAGLEVADVVGEDVWVVEVSASFSPKPGVGSRHALAVPSASRAPSDTTRTLECMRREYRSHDHICLYNHFCYSREG